MGTLRRLALIAVIGAGVACLAGALAAPGDRSKLVWEATIAGKPLSYDAQQTLRSYQERAMIRAVVIGAGAGLLTAGLIAAILFLFTARRSPCADGGEKGPGVEKESRVQLMPSKTEPSL